MIILYVCFFRKECISARSAQNLIHRKSSLVKHSHVHDELMPFVCSVCQKTFVYKDSLNQHKLTHKDLSVSHLWQLSNRGVVCTNTRAPTNQQNTHATLVGVLGSTIYV